MKTTNFMEKVIAYNETVQPTQSTTNWASAAWAIISVLSSSPGDVSEAAADQFAQLVASAPDAVVTGGTVALMNAHAQLNSPR